MSTVLETFLALFLYCKTLSSPGSLQRFAVLPARCWNCLHLRQVLDIVEQNRHRVLQEHTIHAEIAGIAIGCYMKLTLLEPDSFLHPHPSHYSNNHHNSFPIYSFC